MQYDCEMQEDRMECKNMASRDAYCEESEDVDMGGMYGGDDDDYGSESEEEEKAPTHFKNKAAFAPAMKTLMDQRDKQMEKEKFEEVEATSEYMETHYYRETNVTDFLYLVQMN